MLRDLWTKATRNPGFKILSFVLAFLAWWYVQQEQVHEARIRVAVEWQLPQGLTSPDVLPKQVTIAVRGTGVSLKRSKDARVRLPVDVKQIGVGQHEVEFMAFEPIGLPEGVEVLGSSPTAMRFTLDETEIRKVTIAPVLVGTPSPGHIIGEVTVVPPVVEIAGPRTLVSKLLELPTKPLDISNVDEDLDRAVELALPRNVTLTGGAVAAKAHIPVEPELERRVLSAVPVSVWGQHGWTSRPTVVEVTLEGASGALEQVTPIDVAAFVHLPDKPENPFYEVPYGPKEGVRVRIAVAGQTVRVAKVEPELIEVWRQ